MASKPGTDYLPLFDCQCRTDAIIIIIILYYTKAAVHLQHTIQSIKSNKMSTCN